MNLEQALAESSRPPKRDLLAERTLDAMRADGRGDEADQLAAFMLDESFTTYRLEKMFGLLGYPLGANPIAKYRKRHG